MHYKNGRAAKLEVTRSLGAATIRSLLVKSFRVMPGATSCNCQVRTTSVSPMSPNGVFTGITGVVTDADTKANYCTDQNQTFTAADLIHAEDALAEIEKAIANAIPPTPETATN